MIFIKAVAARDYSKQAILKVYCKTLSETQWKDMSISRSHSTEIQKPVRKNTVMRSKLSNRFKCHKNCNLLPVMLVPRQKNARRNGR